MAKPRKDRFRKRRCFRFTQQDIEAIYHSMQNSLEAVMRCPDCNKLFASPSSVERYSTLVYVLNKMLLFMGAGIGTVSCVVERYDA